MTACGSLLLFSWSLALACALFLAPICDMLSSMAEFELKSMGAFIYLRKAFPMLAG